MKLIYLTMKLFFYEMFHCDLRVIKIGGFESLNFDFWRFNFDTKKLISFAKVAKSLIQAAFAKKKRNASIVSILAFQYGADNRT